MRIRLLTVAGSWSGAEVHTLGLVQTLSQRGHDVALLELGRNRYATHGGSPVPIIHVPLDDSSCPNSSFDQISTRHWRRMLAEHGADVGILVKGEFNVGTFELDRAARAIFDRFITIEHLVFPAKVPPAKWLGLPRPQLWLYRQRYRRWIRSKAPSLVIAVSDAVRSTLIDDYGFAAGKIVAVQNGVDVQKFKRTTAARAATRATWGVGAETLVFGSVGRLSPMKNHRMAIEAFARIRAEGPDANCKLVLVGDGPSRKELEDLAHVRKVASDLLFPGFSDEPQAALSAVDVFVLPSHNEGLSLSMLEAMACECAPIVTAVGGAPEVLNSPDIGWLVRPGDADEFHAAMVAAIAEGSKGIRRVGMNARAHVSQHFNATTQFAKLAEIIEAAAEH
jgi:glycosyltransferase involved in cell wall biosynthesis